MSDHPLVLHLCLVTTHDITHRLLRLLSLSPVESEFSNTDRRFCQDLFVNSFDTRDLVLKSLNSRADSRSLPNNFVCNYPGLESKSE